MPRTSHVTHIKSRKPSAKAESFLFSCGIIYVNLMVSSRGVPINNTVDTHNVARVFGVPATRSLNTLFHIVNSLLYCRFDPFLIPTGLRTIALQKNRREVAG